MSILKKIKLIKILPKLGLRNLVRVITYRLSVASGVNPVCYIKPNLIDGNFFRMPESIRLDKKITINLEQPVRYFDHIEVPVAGDVPNWFFRPASNTTIENSHLPWWKSSHFNENVGDIKDIWDISRFGWIFYFVKNVACGCEDSLIKLNLWLDDWYEKNKPYIGFNWMCGQEAAIRVMHLAMAAKILTQVDEPMPALRNLIRLHLKRIRPTVRYAIAQDNNHGICEAAALFIGGSWLYHLEKDAVSLEWMERGRAQLEERTEYLVGSDGGFSMYSIMYHREFLDAMSMAEVWRQTLSLPDFSKNYLRKAGLAARWLGAFVQENSGDVPNIGANDGTRLFPIIDTGYRDSRPSVQLAYVLFCKLRAFGNAGSWDQPIHWLNIKLPKDVLSPSSELGYSDIGFVKLTSNSEDVQTFIRFPNYKFRPSHADAFHIDFWLDGVNILRGPGSYRYNTDFESMDYFPSIKAHNSVQFDDQEAMPRLGRFLFGDWLKIESSPEINYGGESKSFHAKCRHASGALHERHVTLQRGCLLITDNLSCFQSKAVIRWRLVPGDWVLNEMGIELNGVRLTIEGALVNSKKIKLVDGWESRFYGIKTKLPVLEIEVNQASEIITRIEWGKE